MSGPAMDGGGPIAAADDGADGDDGDIDQEVSAITRVAGVVERFEVGGDGADIDELGHRETPLDRSMSASTRRTVACAQLIVATESKISGRSPSRQTTQAAQLCALAVGPAYGIGLQCLPAGQHEHDEGPGEIFTED